MTLRNSKIVETFNAENWNNRAFCSEKSSKLFLTNDEWIDLVSYDFQNYEKITFQSSEKLNYQNAYLGTNDVVFILSNPDVLPDGYAGKLCAYDSKTQKLLNTLIFPNRISGFVVSRDGKYVALFSGGFETAYVSVYEYSQEGFALIYHENFPYYNQGYDPQGIYFNEKISSQLIITLSPGSGNNETYVVDLLTHSKSAKIKTSYVCSDPFTGNIVTMDGYECAVYDQTFTRELYRQWMTDVDYIFNNCFFTFGWGDIPKLYYLDMTNYFKK